MNTPPRSEFRAFSFSNAYSRAPKRPSLKRKISPPHMKLLDPDAQSNKAQKQRQRQEREMKQDIMRQVKNMTSEDWMFRGTPNFSGSTL